VEVRAEDFARNVVNRGAACDGIGPPLADHDWIYGGGPGQRLTVDRTGAPVRDAVICRADSKDQVWKIVAYISSLAEIGSVEGGGGDESRGER
jgi:hypothetical protein